MTDTQHEAAERVSEGRLDAARKAFIKNVKQQDPEWTEDCDEGERLLTSPEGDYFAIDAALSAAIRAHDAGQAGVVVKPLEWEQGETRSSLGDLYTVHKLSENVWSTRKNGTAFAGWKPTEADACEVASSDYRARVEAALSTSPAEPTPSLVGDALAAAGQSIGMSVTRVHPEPEKVGEADEAALLRLTAKGDALLGWIGEPLKAAADVRAWEDEKQRAFRLALSPATPPVADARRVEELPYEFLSNECAAAWDNVRIPGDKFWVELPTNVQVLAMQAFRRGVAHARATLKGDSNGQ